MVHVRPRTSSAGSSPERIRFFSRAQSLDLFLLDAKRFAHLARHELETIGRKTGLECKPEDGRRGRYDRAGATRLGESNCREHCRRATSQMRNTRADCGPELG